MGLINRRRYDLRILIVVALGALSLTAWSSRAAEGVAIAVTKAPASVVHSEAPLKTVGAHALVETGTTQAPQLQLVYPPSDIVVNGAPDCARTTLTLRLTNPNGTISGVQIVGGLLKGKGAEILPAQAFEISIVTPPPGSQVSSQVTATIRWKDEQQRAGTYSGTFLIGTNDIPAAVPVTLNVSYRPRRAWWIGTIAIVIGAGISWLSMVWVARMRTKAENEVFVGRLAETLQSLKAIVDKNVATTGITCPETLDHLGRLFRVGLAQLLSDGELSALAGITVPANGVTIVDEIGGLSGVIQIGFAGLMTAWNASPGADHTPMLILFEKMDALGGRNGSMADLAADIQGILANIPQSPQGYEMALSGNVQVRQGTVALPSERAIVHRVVSSTYILDIVSLATVVLVGIYSLIWSNPGFGSAGDYIVAFLWGIGLKFGSDVVKLSPSDVRTAFAMKIPTAVS